MSDSRYSTIFINYDRADHNILTTQLKMLKERFRSYVVLIMTSDDDRDFLDKNSFLFEEVIYPEKRDVTDYVLEFCSQKHIDTVDALYIGKLADNSLRLKESGFEIKDPYQMVESYKNAIKMLRA
ncbi:hypothetical protein [Butyrivibrio sp. AC2005]|uniref:hypothetical protein n=1 Tax=Butyrivibrio sp. AC2005 TaxID=1280672 RepID=UPI0003FCF7E5|nr:hypothetical protein [Butyrivibrio sp. AC2005]